MQFLKLTPLQSRFAASFVATAVLIIIYLSLSPYHFAYAAELDSVLYAEHAASSNPENGLTYESEFLGVDRGIIGRADSETTSLSNNVASNLNIEAGAINYYVFPNASVWGPHGETGSDLSSLFRRHVPLLESMNSKKTPFAQGIKRRQSGGADYRTAYISINVCKQPVANGTSTGAIPQLTLYVSTNNQKPGPDAGTEVQLEEGFANHTLNTTGDVYVSVYAPPIASGTWNYDIAASIDNSYHSYHQSSNSQPPSLFWSDSDDNSALFITPNFNATEDVIDKWMTDSPPLTLFTFPNNSSSINGVRHSYCALNKIFAESTDQPEAGMTRRGLGNGLKEQFFVQGLNASTSYQAFLATNGNSTNDSTDASDEALVGGGGQLWAPINFTTKADANCQVIYNLSFCSEVAYAVPSNPQNFNRSALAGLYDNSTSTMYENFNYSLQQIPCNTTSSAQYSLARNCTDCARDYKNWLCAVSIPKCADFSSNPSYGFLKPRNLALNFINGSAPDRGSVLANLTLREEYAANSSRNPLIDQQIKPGPWKEILPCEDLCYSLVRSCPAKLGFACPLAGLGLEQSYGKMLNTSDLDNRTCNDLGVASYLNSSNVKAIRSSLAIGTMLVVSIVITFVY